MNKVIHAQEKDTDKIFEFYQSRYNLLKMAQECGFTVKYFESLSSREKILLLSHRLREINKTNLASFFYGKLFEVSMDIDSLLCKIDCLIELSEFDEAIRHNQTGWEIFLEDYNYDKTLAENRLCHQKASILFYTQKYNHSKYICEESIIKFHTQEFYSLLCANLVAMDMYYDAEKLFSKYSAKFNNSDDFLIDTIVYLLNDSLNKKTMTFINHIYSMNNYQKIKITDFIDKYYSFSHNKSALKEYFKKEIIKQNSGS